MKNYRHMLWLFAGAFVLAMISWLGLGAGGPGIPATYPLLLLMPAFMVVDAFGKVGLPLVPVITPALFLVWSSHLFGGTAVIPRRSYIVLILIIILSVTYFVFAWSYGVRWQGPTYTTAIMLINGAVALMVVWLGVRGKRSPSFVTNFAYHFSIFAWLSYLAFPSLGELP